MREWRLIAPSFTLGCHVHKGLRLTNLDRELICGFFAGNSSA